jgi:hypothetical protein
MADGYKLWKDCPHCVKGKQKFTGEQGGDSVVEIPCTQCNGSGFIFLGWCSVDTYTLPTGLPDPE